MNVEFKKTQEWKFPCLGKLEYDNHIIIINFTEKDCGTVIFGEEYLPVYYDEFNMFKDMENIEPITINKDAELLDANIGELGFLDITQTPIYLKNRYYGNILSIEYAYDFGTSSHNRTYCLDCSNIIGDSLTHYEFDSIEDRDEWLSNYQIIPKGTEIKIVI